MHRRVVLVAVMLLAFAGTGVVAGQEDTTTATPTPQPSSEITHETVLNWAENGTDLTVSKARSVYLWLQEDGNVEKFSDEQKQVVENWLSSELPNLNVDLTPNTDAKGSTNDSSSDTTETTPETKDAQNDGETSQNQDNVYEAELNPNLRVVETEWDGNTIHIILEADIPQRITLTDGSKAAAAGEGTFEIPTKTLTIPSGRTEVTMSATESEKVGAVVTLGHRGGLQGFKREVKTPDPLARLISLKLAISGIGMFLVGIVARVGYKVYRKQENGPPETMDGVKITQGKVGVTDDDE